MEFLPQLREKDGLYDSPNFRVSLTMHDQSVSKLSQFAKSLHKDILGYVQASQGIL